MTRSSAGRKAVLLVAALVVCCAACSGGAAPVDRSAPVTQPAAHHVAPVTSRIVLPSDTLVSGRSERGTLVVSNTTDRPIHWTCGYLEVQLVNADHPLEVHPTPCSRKGTTLRVGTTRLPFTVRAARVVCQGSCAAFPPGRYRTQLLSAPSVVRPRPVTVRVVDKT